MRASARRIFGLLLAASATSATGALAHEPDPTELVPVAPAPLPAMPPVAGAPEPDPCDLDPRCRIFRARSEREHERRLEYLRRVADAGRAMDRRILDGMPSRLRYQLGVDLLLSQHAVPGVVLSLAPLWWLKLEGYLGRFSSRQSLYDGGVSRDIGVDGVMLGSSLRFLPIKWALSPYGSVGWELVSGSISQSSYTFDNTGSHYTSSGGDATAHLVALGLGLELVVPYFHVGIGYQYDYAFYTQSSMQHVHDPDLQKGLDASLAKNRHLVVFEIGSVF